MRAPFGDSDAACTLIGTNGPNARRAMSSCFEQYRGKGIDSGEPVGDYPAVHLGRVYFTKPP